MNKVFIPISIVVCGLIIAGAMIMTSKQQQTVNTAPAEKSLELSITPVSSEDHIRGNPDAEVVIVEYSDYECSFCKGFHGTMNRIMEEYGTTGKVAWVYRHFPLPKHEGARPATEASECVARIGGNDKFWEYSEVIIAGAPTSLTTENLLAAATQIGIDETEFNTCLASDYPKQKVDQDIADGTEIAKADRDFGTPYNIVISKSGTQTVIRGNQPYATVKGVIDTILTAGESN